MIAVSRRLRRRAARLRELAEQRFSSSLLGHFVRRAVREHHYVFPPGADAAVTIGPGAALNDALLNVSSGTIAIGRNALVAHGVSILTGTHDYRRFGDDRRYGVPAAGRDIVIGEGVWIASNATVVGPCTIGEHAVIAAGSVVVADVAPYTVVAGIPARVVAEIPHS